jgi:hypothetical protein
MAAIAKVNREVYVPSPKEGVSAVVSTKYTGRGLWREETLSYQASSDWSDTHQMRTSEDGGRTWSEWRMFRKEWPMQGGFTKTESPCARCYDPESGKMVQFVFQRILIGEGTEALAKSWTQEAPTYFDHNFWQISDDEGRTWGGPHQLRYEDGPFFDPDDWGNNEYLRTNRMYGCYNAVATREGTIVYPACEVPLEITDRGKKETVGAVLCFIGKWQKAANIYQWELADPIYVPHRISGRGLQEPCITQLSDGRLFLMMRGSNVVVKSDPWKGEVESPGRKWMSLSEDGGRTWTPVTDLRYDTGEQFYSPAAFAKMLRHSRTGKLYWFGNITPAPPDGNRPRYPLYIAEVEESIPAIKKETLTVIDDRDPKMDPELVQFSNFNLFEHPETGQIELYMTRYGETPGNMWTANAYKYAITLV